MKLKTGRNEIIYLLTKVVEKHESKTGNPIVRNTNRKNYEGVAKRLSEISNALPHTAAQLAHAPYPPDYNPNQLTYPFRKYDITASQVKDAFLGIVNNPRPFLVDACYIYLYGIGRKGFSENPQDVNLIDDEEASSGIPDIPIEKIEALQAEIRSLREERTTEQNKVNWTLRKQKVILLAGLGIGLILLLCLLYKWVSTNEQLVNLRNDLFFVPHQPTIAEIDSLEGIWLSYTGSPQARSSDSNRYHMVISNIIEVTYKGGYFTFTRYGANFNHVGYMQYDAPGLVSVRSFARKNTGSLESPKYSLMQLKGEGQFIPVISASWNFDAGKKNKIIGIREVYIKQGKGGRIEEVFNSPENVSCRCKIIKWRTEPNKEKIFYLKNELLDTLSSGVLRSLLDEKSILPRLPQEITIFSSDTIKR